MNKTKFTPGSWKVTEEIDGVFGLAHEQIVICAVNKQRIAICGSQIRPCINDRIQREANAFPIALAPKMYKLLDEICSKIFDGTIKNEDARNIENLLKEARGEK